MSGLLLTVHDWQIFLQELETSLDSGIWRFREQEVPFWAWHEEFARLRIWADNIGLYKARKPSPDEVLSELPLVKSQITRELARIRRLIRDIEEEVLTYEYGDSTATESYTDSESDDDEEEESITVFQDIYCHLKDSIDGLNRMSTIVSQRARSATEGLKSAGTEKKSTTRPPQHEMRSARKRAVSVSEWEQPEARRKRSFNAIGTLYGVGQDNEVYICCQCNKNGASPMPYDTCLYCGHRACDKCPRTH